MLSVKIAGYVLNTEYDDLPHEVRHKAKECFIDWLACAFAGSGLKPVLSMLEALVGEGRTGKCRIIGHNKSMDSLTAALINGTMAHAIEFDDIYKFGLYHPAAPIIASAFAVAETTGSSGSEFLNAVVLGYEASNRLAEAVNPSHYKFWHTTGTVGTFGAAVAASKLLNLSQEQIVWAIGNAGTQAAGLWECTGTMAKPLHAGKAAMNGLLAALLAKEGFTGPAAILEGPAGFIESMSDVSENIDQIFSTLGKENTILEMTFKAYPSCGHTHAPIGAALAIKKEHVFENSDIKQIRVDTYSSALQVAGTCRPHNSTEAKFSIPFCVACAIDKGSVLIGDFENWPLSSSIKELMEKTILGIDQECENAFPGKRGARVTIETKQGSYEKYMPYRKGDPECPLNQEELWSKFVSLASFILNPNQIEDEKNILDRLGDQDNLSNIKVYGG